MATETKTHRLNLSAAGGYPTNRTWCGKLKVRAAGVDMHPGIKLAKPGEMPTCKRCSGHR
jgi:hypothetical protein